MQLAKEPGEKAPCMYDIYNVYCVRSIVISVKLVEPLEKDNAADSDKRKFKFVIT